MTTIRLARTDDATEVDRLYDICLRTGDSGEDATGRYTDPRLLGEVYLGAYLALEPGLAFVAERDGAVVGYALGTTDTRGFEARCEASWWPPLRERHPLDGVPDDAPDAWLVRQIHRPPLAEDAVVAAFPAHLHVDLLPQGQGGGNGRRLLETLFDALRDAGAPGVHLGVADTNTRAIGFYEHLGFRRLDVDGYVMGLAL